MSSPILIVDRLTKRFASEGPLVVREVSFDVSEGEIVALLGPSGCGKTTTLRCIAGFEQATSGSVRMRDCMLEGPEAHVPPEERGIGLVFQDYALFPHLSVLENVAFGLRSTPEPERTERAKKSLEMVGLSGYHDRSPHHLSGGQQQRVALARTLAPQPDLILLDEPFSNLDALLREGTRQEVRVLLKERNMSAVLVTHDQEEALSFADRVAVMRGGQIEQVGTPEEVYTRPVNEFVAGFIGEPATNFVGCTPHEDGATIVPSAPAELSLDVPAGTRTLGVRPEDLYLADDASGAADPSEPIPFTVGVREPQGYAVELTLERGGTEVRAWVRDPPDEVLAGREVELVLDRERVHCFDEDGAAMRR